MLRELVTLKGLIKNKSYHIDFPFFRIHYQATVCLLLAFCLILTAKVLFGDVIDCKSRNGGRDDLADNMCYAVGTYTRYKISQDNSTFNVTFKVDPDYKYLYSGILVGDVDATVFWHDYYQYVPLILFLQAIMFYFPHYLWKMWENGMISSVCKRLYEHRFSPSDYLETNYDIIYYLHNRFKFNTSLVYKYYSCHVLLLLNLVVQVIVLNKIFNNQFMFYGYVMIKYFMDENVYGIQAIYSDQEDNSSDIAYVGRRNLNNPMDLVFPKVASCRIDTASQGGNVPDKHEYLCILPLNIFHDKFYLLLWFWFLMLAVLTLLQILYDTLYIILPCFRRYMFHRRYSTDIWGSDNRRSTTLSELFLLDLIGSNTDRFVFSTLLKKLNKEDWTANPSENQSIV